MIDGEDLIIKGAGIQEIRLRSGQHTFQAMKDGKVLKHELITVTSRGRRVVRVSHEVEPLVADEAWKRSVAAMSADEQIAAVRERLKSLNPSFDGQLKGTIHLGILERLSVHGMGLRDLSPLTVFENLSWLEFADKNPVRDLTPIASLDLPSLSLGSPLLTDLSPLKNCKGLTYLDLTNCRRLSDLRPLAGIALTQLHLSGAAVYDLSPLKGMKLEVLNCEICERLTDITPLAGMPMRKLYLRGTGVTDLSPLRGMPLKTFDYVSTHVTDITPLKDLPLEGVHCDFEPGRDAAILRSIRTLRTINGQPASEFWKAVDNTVRGSDAAR